MSCPDHYATLAIIHAAVELAAALEQVAFWESRRAVAVRHRRGLIEALATGRPAARRDLPLAELEVQRIEAELRRERARVAKARLALEEAGREERDEHGQDASAELVGPVPGEARWPACEDVAVEVPGVADAPPVARASAGPAGRRRAAYIATVGAQPAAVNDNACPRRRCAGEPLALSMRRVEWRATGPPEAVERRSAYGKDA